MHHDHSPLYNFENELKLPVELRLFFFSFAQAGVPFATMNMLTWIILPSLLVGQFIGIGLFSGIAHKVGFPMPDGMGMKHLLVAGIIAGLGLTVALFVAGEAFGAPEAALYLGPAKMGAVFSAVAAVLAIVVARRIGIKRQPD